ncbi:EAL domain-containing protein [Sphingobium aquiterrae]|uniref:EAL domain-containing protein n=1 Tax=Sphingobium aquiterrae TaxID=2038656 RepID=UPI003019FEAC
MLRPSASQDHSHRATPLAVSLGLADGGVDTAPDWLVNAMRSICVLWPLVILCKLAGTMLAIDFPLLWADGRAGPLAAMAAAALLVDVAIWLAPSQRRFRNSLPHVQMWVMMPLVFLSGMMFGATLGGFADGRGAGMVPAGLPLAAVTLLVASIFGSRRILGLAFAVGLGGVLAMMREEPAYLALTVFYLMAMGIAAVRQAVVDQRRLIRRQVAEQGGRRAQRLLVEHERSGRGWFWETDRHGRIIYLSETLAATLGADSADFIGKPLTELVSPSDRQQGDGERTLGFHLSARTAFSEIPVHVATSDEERSWAISGQPIINDYGQFKGFRGSGTDLTEMRRSQAEVTRLAQYDSLTGLANRVQMLRTLEQAVIGPRGVPNDCALFLLDLDRFKSVNDTMGHPAGDSLLRMVSQRLSRVIGERGRVGRLGGDEFKIVMPGRHDRALLADIALAVIDSVSQPYVIEGSQVVIGASIGIALCPEHGVTADALIRNADLALYAAKGDGRGTFRFYTSEMHADAEDRRQLEEDLRVALNEDALQVFYQPVVSAATEQVTGYEALLRWDHPTRGFISPAVFVPIAEDTGLIARIGDWVLRTACRDAATWPEDIRVAVNVSPIQFANPSLPNTVMSALIGAGLDAGRLELEITESVFLNDDADTDSMFSRLKNLGVRLALDDFGTGYSSLGYLKTAPFDKIKIDQSFVRGAAIQGSRNGAIIKMIVGLAEALSMDTTAEGAETHDELELIRMLGCSHVQGYIYGKPQPADVVTRSLIESGTAAAASGFRASRPTRKSMLRSVTVRHDGHRYNGRIRNISSTGALIEGLWNVPEGTLFHIELTDHYVVEARARWSVEDRMGVEFMTGINLEKLQAPLGIRNVA